MVPIQKETHRYREPQSKPMHIWSVELWHKSPSTFTTHQDMGICICPGKSSWDCVLHIHFCQHNLVHLSRAAATQSQRGLLAIYILGLLFAKKHSYKLINHIVSRYRQRKETLTARIRSGQALDEAKIDSVAFLPQTKKQEEPEVGKSMQGTTCCVRSKWCSPQASIYSEPINLYTSSFISPESTRYTWSTTPNFTESEIGAYIGQEVPPTPWQVQGQNLSSRT